MTDATARNLRDAYMAGVRDGKAQATHDAQVRLNQLVLDMVAHPLGERLLGNASGAGSVPAV
jgi:hypothetical protein